LGARTFRSLYLYRTGGLCRRNRLAKDLPAL